uniref:Protein ABIL3 n=1 Tax=Anthurium amnicola TaxID=1678845 RepID=A0A1D1XKM1_9ARAE
METLPPSSASSTATQDHPSSLDELSMQEILLFSDSLKDLRNLRSQLYSAAEYFELSYTNDDRKQIVVDTLKDYTIKAVVNAVDHLGSVSYKVNGLLDEKVNEVSGTDVRVSCIEQRLRTCQEFIDHEGFSQQSLVISTPKYHKRYILPGKLRFLLMLFRFSYQTPKNLKELNCWDHCQENAF